MNTTSLPLGIDLHTLKSGRTSYEARVNRRPLGELTRRFKSLEQAIDWRNQAIALIDAGFDPQAALPKKKSVIQSKTPLPNAASSSQPDTKDGAGFTVQEAIKHYLKHRANSHAPLRSNQVSDYEMVANDLGALPAADLRNEDLSNYITLLLRTPLKRDAKKQAKGTLVGKPRTYKEATVRKFVYALKKALEWAAMNGRTTLNPHLFRFETKTMPSAWGGKRERRLSPSEEVALYSAAISRDGHAICESDWRAIIGFALESAMRKQEIVKAEWKDITGNGLKLRIPAANTKTRTARTILLSKRAREIVEEQRKSSGKSPRIFHQVLTAKSLGYAFARLTKRAQVEDLHFHDLRHEATSRLCEGKAGQLPMMAIMEMAGHKSMATFSGYVHLIEKGDTVSLD